jgi:hypothetical protein
MRMLNFLLCPTCRVAPQQYAQWIITTPLMVIILSRMSDFSRRQTAAVVAADAAMVVGGALAHVAPWPFHCESGTNTIRRNTRAYCSSYLLQMKQMPCSAYD